jgi:hypothetical protein
MADDNVVPIEHQIPGRHRIEGTADLEIAYNRRGDDVVVRVNKRGVQVFRVLLVDAAKEMTDDDPLKFNVISPDQVFTIGDMDEGVRRSIKAG